MIKIIVDDDCRNAPKKLVLRDFNIALAEQNREHVLDTIADAICWEIVGEKVMEGKAQVEEALENEWQKTKTSELVLRNIITHGYIAAADGTTTLENGERYAFCDVYRFSSAAKHAKIKEITSYRIKL